MGDLLGSPRVTPFYQLPPVQYPSTSQIVTPQGRGRGGRGFMRDFGQASTSQQGGRSQARLFTLTQQDVQASMPLWQVLSQFIFLMLEFC